MDWDDVRVFYSVARTRSLAGGAREAGLDRSTASRRIASLERALKTRLFLRTRDGLRLSPAGERLFAHAERMDREARALAGAASESGEAVVGLVRIATTESLAAMLVREGLLAIRERHPGIEIDLLGGNRVVDLARGEADLALRVRRVEEPSLVVRRVGLLPIALFASPSYLDRRGRPRTEGELAGHDVIVPGGELATLPEARWLASRAGVRVVLRTSSMTALLAAALDGVGIAPITGPWGERELGLVRLMDLDHLPVRALWLAMHPDAGARAAVRVMADHLAAIAGRGSRPSTPPRAAVKRSGDR